MATPRRILLTGAGGFVGRHLRPGDLHFRLPDLREVARRHVSREEADDDDNHQQLETRAPMYAFVPYTVNNQPFIIGAYTCTPLVRFPVADLKPNSGSKYRGQTIAELGAGNRPIDMIVYRKGGKDFILMANTRRGVMKIAKTGG